MSNYETIRGHVVEVSPKTIVVSLDIATRSDKHNRNGEHVELKFRGGIVKDQTVVIKLNPSGEACWLT